MNEEDKREKITEEAEKAGETAPAGKYGETCPAGNAGENCPAEYAGEPSPAGNAGETNAVEKAGEPAPAGNPGSDDLFRRVKEALPVPKLAWFFGLRPREDGMVRCPFHDDRTPSLKLYKDHFHCFGCRAHGDVVDLAVRMTGLRPGKAARILAKEFHIDIS